MVQVPVQDGDWATAATWGTITDTTNFLLLDSTTSVSLTSSYKYATAFTAPNTSNSVTHIITGLTGDVANTETADIKVVLEEWDGVSAWVEKASGTFASNDLIDGGATQYYTGTGFLMVLLSSPYQFTTTSASYYRVGIKYENAAGGWDDTTLDLKFKSGASTEVVFAVDDRTAVPGTSEDVLIIGEIGSTGGTQHAVKITSSQSCGSDVNVNTNNFNDGEISVGVMIAYNGKLHFDQTADSDLTIKGSLGMSHGSTLEMGTEGTPFPEAYTCKIIIDHTTRDYYVSNNVGNSGADVSLWGAAKSADTLFYSTISGGDGTAADPLITDTAVDWVVGDEIAALPGTDDSTNYNQTEYKFIITKNSSTSYVLADTKGGAEAAFTYVHDGAHIINVERNVIIDGIGASNEINNGFAWEGTTTTNAFSNTKLHIKWIKIMGRVVNWDFGFNTNSNVTLNTDLYKVSHVTAESHESSGFAFSQNNSIPYTYDGIVVFRASDSSAGGISTFNGANKNLTNCFVFDIQSVGLNLGGTGITIDNFICAGVNQGGSSSGAAVKFDTNLANNVIVNNFDCYACRRSIYHSDRTSGVQFLNSDFGERFNNQTQHDSGPSNTATLSYFMNCRFGTNLTLPSVLHTLTGSLNKGMGFQDYQQVTNQNIFNSGLSRIALTGAGFSDTTVRTSGSLAMKVEPTSKQAAILTFKVVARPNKAVTLLGFAKRNSSLTTTVTIGIRLPNTLDFAASTTLAAGTDWQLFSIATTYTGTTNRYATVEIKIPYDSSGGVVYFDDFLNGNNVITALDLWDLGSPSPILYNELGNPGEVWDVVNSGFAAGTMGTLADDTHTKADDASVISILKS